MNIYVTKKCIRSLFFFKQFQFNTFILTCVTPYKIPEVGSLRKIVAKKPVLYVNKKSRNLLPVHFLKKYINSVITNLLLNKGRPFLK